jgi:choline-sulfatase
VSLLRLSRPDEWDTLASKLARGLTAAGLAGTVAATVDILFADADLSLRALMSSAGLGLGFGLALGALWAGLGHLLARSPRFVSWIVWFGLAFWSFGRVAHDLRAVANLGTRYNGLAVGTLIACGLAALGTGALLLLVQPTRTGPPPLTRAPRWTRWVVGVGLAVSAFVLTYVDRTQFPGQYASFHIALQGSALFCWAIAILLSGMALAPRTPAVRISGGILAALLVVSPFVLLHAPLQPASETVLSRPYSALPFRTARLVADFDGDGSSPVLGGGDCAPFDAKVNPQQREVADNGIDDNCFGGDAHPIVAAAHQDDVPVPSRPSPQHVILITIDTLRPDRMSVYGYERDTTPAIASWFGDGTKFTRAYAAGGWTSIAIPAILQGVSPRRLQWTRMYETNRYRYLKAPLGDQLRPGETPRAMFLLPLTDPHWSLATYLRRRGMFTAAVVDGGFTEILSRKWGTAQGFDAFIEIGSLARNLRNDAQTADQAIDILRSRPEGRPFFLWVHFFGPHAPSKRHPGISLAGDTEGDKYDGEIIYVDQQVGRLLAVIDEQTDRPVTVLLASDHGERLYNERSRGHGSDHSEDNIRIPLLAKGPGFAMTEVDVLSGAIDLMPTILAVTETPAPAGLDGVDLRALAASPGEHRGRTLLVDTFVFDKSAGDTGTNFRLDLVSAVSGPHKLTMNRLDNTLGLYDVVDPAKAGRNMLAGEDSELLEERLRTYLDETGGAPLIVD